MHERIFNNPRFCFRNTTTTYNNYPTNQTSFPINSQYMDMHIAISIYNTYFFIITYNIYYYI